MQFDAQMKERSGLAAVGEKDIYFGDQIASPESLIEPGIFLFVIMEK